MYCSSAYSCGCLACLALAWLCSVGCDELANDASSAHDKQKTAAIRAFNDASLHEIIKVGGRNRLQRAQRLISAGVDLDAVDHQGDTAVMLATRWGGQYDLACLLLDAGADHSIYRKNSSMRLAHFVESERVNRAKIWSPKQARDHALLVTLLEERGESFDEVRQDFARWKRMYVGSTATYALLRDQEIAAREARDHAVRVGKNKRRSLGNERVTWQLFQLVATPTEATEDFDSRLQELIDAGVDLDQTSDQGETPAMYAVRQHRQFGFALALLRAGADPKVHRRAHGTEVELRATLIHYVAAAGRGSHTFTEEEREEYQSLVNWFVERGESIERAREELPLASLPLEDGPGP